MILKCSNDGIEISISSIPYIWLFSINFVVSYPNLYEININVMPIPMQTILTCDKGVLKL